MSTNATTPTALPVATTILEQLGGRKFMAMTGAKGFLGSPDSLQFGIPKAKDGINKVVVTLTVDDTYTVQFWRCSARPTVEMTMLAELSGVYYDGLQDVFTSHTGLRTSF